MSAEIYVIHPKNPEIRKIQNVAAALNDGAVIIYPTDTGYTLGCNLSNKEGIARIRQLRNIQEGKSLTFLCDSLTRLSDFARVSNKAYKTMRRLVPGPFTFILPASKLVPYFAQDTKRRTAGIRIPDNILSLFLLKELGHPIISISAKIDGNPYTTYDEVLDYFAKQVDVAVKVEEPEFVGQSTIIDMTTDEFKILREGAGTNKLKEYMYTIEE
jgi:tRNA threonylcarbamoyl adenosine modification protein (Sua5/YciO/YrdC/YwlC family)